MTRCVACYHADKRLEAAAMRRKRFSGERWQQTFDSFIADWSTWTVLGPHTAGQILKHGRFMIELSHAAAGPELITEARLFEVLTPSRIHQGHAVISWLKRQGHLAFLTEEVMDAEAARLEQRAILERTPEGWRRDVLHRYLQTLRARAAAFRARGWTGADQKFLPRTITLFMRAAWRFITDLAPDVHGPQAIEQPMVDSFVRRRPGHRSSAVRFVRYLYKEEHTFTPLRLKSAPRDEFNRMPIPPEKSNELLAKWLRTPQHRVRNSLLCVFMLLYARTATQVCILTRGDFTFSRDGSVRAHFGKVPLPLDELTAKLLTVHVAELEGRRGRPLLDEDYLFPSRIEGQHLRRASVRPITRCEHVTARQLYATALAEMFRMGLKIPRVLSRALGISIHTAMEYQQVFDSRIIQEVRQRGAKR